MKYNIELLERKRLEIGWSKRKISDNAGVKYTNVLSVFSGKNQAPWTVNQIAAVLGLSPKDIISG